MEPNHIAQGGHSIYFPGIKTGVLLLHGFTGTTQGVEFWAYYLSKVGYTVHCPLLPGHGGSSWRDLNKTTGQDWYGTVEAELQRLQGLCDDVFVMGVSMGGTLALKLAEDHPDTVKGLVLVNPSITTLDKRAILAPILKWVLPSIKGIGSDIKKVGAREISYHRMPTKAFDSLRQLWKVTRSNLNRVTCPVLLYRSPEDHVVEPVNAQIILNGVSSQQKEERLCPDSYHVATLDNDAPAIFEGSIGFLQQYASHPPIVLAPVNTVSTKLSSLKS